MAQTKLKVAGQEILVPTAMYDALLGDAEASGFVNLDAAESLRYELLEWETGEYADVDSDEWLCFLETARAPGRSPFWTRRTA